MKVIFLDIDGVLNSEKYDAERSADDGNIDITRLDILKRVTDKTGALIVLTSTWRKMWEKDRSQISEQGMELERVFSSAGLEIYDKTPVLSWRSDEIKAWLEERNDIESFVIIDDMPFGWGELSERLVKTSAAVGRGLEEAHAERAIEILETPLKKE